MIREATIEDLALIATLCRELYNEAMNHNKVYGWNQEKAINVCRHLIGDEKTLVIIDESKSRVTGFFIGTLSSPLACDDVIAADLMMFVRPAYRGKSASLRMIRYYEKWAKSNGALYAQLGVSSGVEHDKALGMYKRMGYTLTAVTCIRGL